MRVLQLGSPTGLYGAERWILALVKHLDPQKVESWVGVIKDAPELEAPLLKEARQLGFSTRSFEAHGKASFAAVRQLRRFIREERIEILHTHFYKTDLLGLLATLGTSCRILSTPHGWSQECDFKLKCYELLDRAIFPFLDGVAPLSEDLHSPLARLPFLGKKLHLIRNGVDISEIDAVAEVAPEIAAWKKEGFWVVGYIGQLIARKRLDTLLHALSLVRDRPWRLALVGEGDQKEALATLAVSLGIDAKVRFFGFRRDRIALLKGFDAFVLPSLLEGIPRCLMEAMAAGVPVVASDIPGCRDLVAPGQTGFLFSAGDAPALAERLSQLANSPGLAGEFAANGRRLIDERFSARRMAREYEQLYASLLPGGG